VCACICVCMCARVRVCLCARGRHTYLIRTLNTIFHTLSTPVSRARSLATYKYYQTSYSARSLSLSFLRAGSLHAKRVHTGRTNVSHQNLLHVLSRDICCSKGPAGGLLRLPIQMHVCARARIHVHPCVFMSAHIQSSMLQATIACMYACVRYSYTQKARDLHQCIINFTDIA